MATKKYIISAFMLTRPIKEQLRKTAFKKRTNQSAVVRQALLNYFDRQHLIKDGIIEV